MKLTIEANDLERIYLRLAVKKAMSAALCSILDTKADEGMAKGAREVSLYAFREEFNRYAGILEKLNEAEERVESEC